MVQANAPASTQPRTSAREVHNFFRNRANTKTQPGTSPLLLDMKGAPSDRGRSLMSRPNGRIVRVQVTGHVSVLEDPLSGSSIFLPGPIGSDG